ncbi:unnamed protein product [Acanthocheilonema viteae]|uniref:Uncharacterized protein n=1 Tax=Acanthocheilonema viteae TaxID=6277 RepID=A0A498SBG6_ACAVI|nr:unnamed protein product [Acanthocheilonema viteae]
MILGGSVYGTADKAVYLEAHSNFGKNVSSLPGASPRMFMFDNKIRDWVRWGANVNKHDSTETSIQEMRKIGEIAKATTICIFTLSSSDAVSGVFKMSRSFLSAIQPKSESYQFTETIKSSTPMSTEETRNETETKH